MECENITLPLQSFFILDVSCASQAQGNTQLTQQTYRLKTPCSSAKVAAICCNVCSHFRTIDPWSLNLDRPPTQLLQEIIAHCPLQTSGVCRNLHVWPTTLCKIGSGPKNQSGPSLLTGQILQAAGARAAGLSFLQHEAQTRARSTRAMRREGCLLHAHLFGISCWIQLTSSAVSSRVPLRRLHLRHHGT